MQKNNNDYKMDTKDNIHNDKIIYYLNSIFYFSYMIDIIRKFIPSQIPMKKNVILNNNANILNKLKNNEKNIIFGNPEIISFILTSIY